MSQIPLSLRKKLSYNPKSFVWHEGVKKIQEEVFSDTPRTIFRPYFIQGAPRSGKTHLSFTIAEEFRSQEVSIKLISGHQQFIRSLDQRDFHEVGVVIFDAAEETLRELSPEDSGTMIDFFEQAKSAANTLLIISNDHYLDANLDQHLLSRFKITSELSIGDPSDKEVIDLVSTLALQRGIKLKAQQLSYLAPRLPKAIEDIEQFLERLSYLAVSSNSSINRNTISKAL